MGGNVEIYVLNKVTIQEISEKVKINLRKTNNIYIATILSNFRSILDPRP